MKYVLSLFVIVLFAVGCESTEPVSSGKLYITTEDVSCTEAWIKVTVNDVALPAELQLFRNDSVAQVINLSKSDTVIYEDSLAPSTEYNYTAKLAGISSGIAAVRTMDTTSHDFTWETYTFGGGSGSLLNDVAIVDENNIWAVGEIHTPETDQYDSNGVWVQPYNAVHWDGKQWELKRIYFYTFCEQEHKAPYVIRAIFSCDDDIMVMASGSQITYIQSSQQGAIECIPASVNAIWGVSNTDFYVVGNVGKIAHYNGSNWEKIESDTEVNLNDIYGYEENVYFLASKLFSGIDSKLYKVEGNKSILQETIYLGRESLSLWLQRNKMIISGGETFEWTSGKNEWENISEEVGSSGIYKIRGQEYNDIIIAGDNNLLIHYNGTGWEKEKVRNTRDGVYFSGKIKGNIICAIGKDYATNSAVISLGKR